LSAIWLTKPETVRRVRQRVRTVLDWARVTYGLSGGNPVDGVEKALPKQPERGEHFAAMPYSGVPAFLAGLRQHPALEISVLALEFLILTACRTNEVLLATWSEFDLAERTWTIPASRMKAGEAHVVPLPPRAIELLAQIKGARQEEVLVFPSSKPGNPFSNMVFLMMLRRMKLEVTAHGFRSSFRDWPAEETSFPNFVVEKALAHTIDDKVEAAPRRGDLLRKRRELVEAWAEYCAGVSLQRTGKPTRRTARRHLEKGNGGLLLTSRH
jgi:integrase